MTGQERAQAALEADRERRAIAARNAPPSALDYRQRATAAEVLAQYGLQDNGPAWAALEDRACDPAPFRAYDAAHDIGARLARA